MAQLRRQQRKPVGKLPVAGRIACAGTSMPLSMPDGDGFAETPGLS